ncbi:MAG: hypothetical protein AEth_00172 [Candidatus Argoarchaeum ethanivorans]|uniref:Uncharacterized protein n=1 Tax=Candidatus Argoarchaeum ethanivorans TaxID=2608793 RepID=A0A8B3S6Y7_9EURY|nr:MAG: hypothetical protein AEth_00172 [Candidatus Argoarchaeum ethanivorans]
MGRSCKLQNQELLLTKVKTVKLVGMLTEVGGTLEGDREHNEQMGKQCDIANKVLLWMQ